MTRLLCGASLTAVALLALPSAAYAQNLDRYWDPNGTATGTGGTGTWNTSSNQWSPNADGVSGPYTPWNNGGVDNAIFGGPNGTNATVTLATPITVHNLTFNANTAYTLTGSTLTLAGTTPTITTNGNAAISSILAGTAGLTKAGAGTLTLTGANSFSGGINVTGGTLSLSGDSSLGAGSNAINLSSGTVLTSAGALNSTRTVTLLGSTGLGGGVGSAHITGAGGFSLVGQIGLSDDTNDFTGSVGTDGYNLYFTSIRNLGEASALGAATTAANGAVFVRAASAIYTGDGDISNRDWSMAPTGTSSALRNQGSGTLTVTGNIYTGGGYTASVISDAGTADLELLGVISSNLANRPFIFMGGGTNRSITLNGINTFGGAVTIQTVTVRANSLANQGIASSLGTGAGASTISLNTGTLIYTGAGGSTDRALFVNGASSLVNDGAGALTLGGAIVFNPANPGDTFTLGGGGGSFTGVSEVSGVISGNGSLVKSGSNSWLISGANTYVGTTTVNAGTLQAGSDQAFGAPNALVVNGGTLDLNGHDIEAISLAGTGGSVTLNGGDLTVNGTASSSYAGSITGTGGLTKRGTSTLTLTGANSYSGATTVNAGTLILAFSASGAPTSNILSSASALTMSGGTLTLIGAAATANSQSLNGLNVSAGYNRIVATSGVGGNMLLNLGALNHTGGLLDFTMPAAGQINTSNADGALGWATINGTDYAQVTGGHIAAFSAYAEKDDAGTWLTGDVVADTGGAANTAFFGTVSGNVQLGGLKYTAAAGSGITIGAGNTLGVDGTIIVASSVNNAGQTITGGSITGAAGGGTLGVQDNSIGTGTFTIASTIVDNGGAISFAKGGPGRVALTGTNSYTGGTTISGGTLSTDSVANGGVASGIGASSADSANLVIESGTLQYTGVGPGTSDRGFTLVNGGPSRTIQVDSGNLSFGGVVVGADDAGFAKTGAGTLTLANAANTYTGVTTISAGTLSVNTLANGGVASGIGASSSDAANLVIQTGGTLQYTGATTSTDRGFTLGGVAGGTVDVANAGTTLTVGGTIVGAVPFHKAGAGTLVLSGANTNTGPTTIDSGTLRAGSTQAFGGPNIMTLADVAGVTLDLNGFNNKVGGLAGGGANGGTVQLGGATLTIGGSNVSFSGTVTGAGGITKENSSAQTFVGCNNSYTGATSIVGGTLSVDCLANGGQASGIGASTSASANLVLSGGVLAYTGGSINIDRGITVGGTGALNVANAATVLGISGSIVGGGAFRKDGAGTLVLSGNNSFTGGLIVNGGVVRAGSTTALSTRGVTMTNAAGVTLDLNNFNTSIALLNGGGAAGGNVTLGTATLTLNWGSGGASFAGAVSGSGGLVKTGAFTQALTSCGSGYTGATTISGGILQVSCLANGGSNSSIGAADASAGKLIISGGTLQYVGAGGSTDRLFTLGASSASRLEASGTGAIAFTGTGPIAFVTPGTAQTIALGGTNTGNNSLAAQITDNGAGVTSLTKDGAGTWILNNPNSSYTGVTTINGGVLGVDKLSDGGLASSIGASSAAAGNLVIGNGSTLRYTGAGDTTNRLFTLSAGTTFIESSGTGAVVFTDTGQVTLANPDQARTIALGGTNSGNNTLAGSIGNAGTGVTVLAKNDAGTWLLTGNNTYTGNTNINAGTLILGNGGTTGSIASATVNNLGTLGFNRSDTLSYGGVIGGTGSVRQLGAGTTVLTGANTYSGGTTIADGTLQIGSGGTTGSITGNVTTTGDGVLTFNRSNALTFAGLISGTGGVHQMGAGTTVLSGANTYSGGTTITGGVLQVASDANLGDAGGGITFDGGTLRIAGDFTSNRDVVLAGAGRVETTTGSDWVLAGDVTGAGALTVNTANTVTLTGDATHTGGTTVTGAGSLLIGSGTSGSIAGDIVNNASIRFQRTDSYTYGGAISGTGSVFVDFGTATLTGDSNWGGSLQILNGGEARITAGNTVSTGGATTVRGTLTIAGAGSALQTTNVNGIAPTGPAVINVENGGTLTASVFTLRGTGSPSPAQLNISGAGSLVEVSSQLNLANSAANNTGDITISGGGTLRTGLLSTIGALTGNAAPPTVTITGTGSNWTSTGVLLMRTGTFSVLDGGAASFDSAQIGTVDASALVSGAGSTFTTAQDLVIGSLSNVDGSGVLTVANGGRVIAGGGITLADDTAGTSGTLNIGGAAGDLAAAAGFVDGAIIFGPGTGTLNFNHTETDYEFASAMSGAGSIKQLAGVTRLTGNSSAFTGTTDIAGGTLLVEGTLGGAASATNVLGGGTLGGTGTIGGNVVVGGGAILAPGSNGVGTLTIGGNLDLSSPNAILNFQLGQANLPGGALNDLVNVGGDLNLNGQLNVTTSPGGTFGPGVYRLFNYGGALTGSGLTNLPSGTFVQTAVLGQVNLANTAGLTLNIWDGAAGPKNDGLIQGGTGTWILGGGQNNWTDANGLVNADYAQNSFAIFQGTGSTVTVDASGGAVQTAGMQFTAGGYTIAGAPLTLTGTQAFIRVGDGSAGDAGLTATIDAQLAGAAQLVKTDGGTLVLAGTNSYTGGTAINGGTLQISSNANLGDAAGGLSFNGGTLHTTASLTMARNIDLAGAGTIDTDLNFDSVYLDGVISGGGALIKRGIGNLVLRANNSYTGGTTIEAGTLVIGNGGTAGWLVGDIVNNGSLLFVRSDNVIFGGTISGSGGLFQGGAGILTLTGDNSYTGNTRIGGAFASALQLGNGGTTGSVVGDIENYGTLIFNRSNEYGFAGTISGAGDVRQEGTGTTILTAANSYTGSTIISRGTLLINGNQTAATGTTHVLGGGTLGGIGTIGGDVFVGGGATLTPGDATGPGTLTINGNLGFSPNATLAYDFGQSNIVGGPLNDLTQVAGDLTLDGTIDVTVAPGGSFGPGLYRVISYGGALTNDGLNVGAMPPGSTVAVQTSIGGQVNLVNAAGGTFNFWDGAAPANESNNSVDGGDGIWQNSGGNNDWTMTDGAVSGAYTDGTFAIFAAAAGTVEIDNILGAVTASGLQFATDGYTITGQDLTLIGPQSIVRVGDGTAGGLGMTATIESRIFGATQLVKADLGTLVLTRNNTYSGGTRIDAGTLRISGDFQLGDAAGALSLNGGTLNTTAAMASGRSVNLLGTGTLLTDAGTSLTLFGSVSGAGGFTKAGTGILTLTGTNSFGGDVDVTAGQMFVNGDQSAAVGATSVASGAVLSGSGIIGGNVALADGAALAPGGTLFGVGTLTINGNLALSAGSVLDFQFGEANVAGGTLNDLVNVGGDLTLDGTINVSVAPGGSFGPGIYRVFNYDGALTDNGLTLGTLPGGAAVSMQTAIAGQVNLVNTAGLTLGFWDGDAGPKNNGVVNGGNGIWRVGGGSNNWTDADGALNADYAQGTFAIFAGARGTVTVDDIGGAVLASGLQFASDGYTITGDALTLTGSQAIVQVGDGSAASASYTTTIASEITGSAGLVKTDAGRLILTGANSYAGGTTIDGGTLQIGNGGATGSITGDIVNNAALVVNRTGTLTLDGAISGSGSLAKAGSGTLVLSGTNSYAGGTTVTGGTVQISSDANLGDVAGRLSLQGGTLQAGASFTSARDILVGSPNSNRIDTQGFDVTLTGTIGNGANNQAGNFLDKIGSGTLTLTGANIYANRTVISGGTLALAGAGRAGVGNIIVGAGTVFDISQTNTGARVIQLNSGPAGTIALGSKMLTLGLDNSFSDWSGTITDGGIAGGTGGSVVIGGFGGAVRYFEANSYTGGTTVLSGSFELVGNGSLHSAGAVNVIGGAVFAIGGLAGTGTTIGDLSGSGSVSLGAKSLTFGTGSNTFFSGTILGNGGTLVKSGAGVFSLTGSALHTGGTTISAGTLQIGMGGTTGSIAGDVVDNATFAFNRSDTLTFDGAISGTGAVSQLGTGATILTAANSYTGTTTVSAGTLRINGDQSAATGLTSVLSGGTLGGSGIIGGSVAVADGGTLAPGNSPGTLTINGDLALSSGARLAFEFGQAGTAGGALNDLIQVGGNLTLDGAIDVTQAAGGSFGPGIYRIINYAGTLTDNGLVVGTMPAGSQGFVQTLTPGQINLVNTAGLTLGFWDGAAGPKNDGLIQGGNGTWRLGGGENNWTEVFGAINADYAQDSFAIFGGIGGTVTVDNAGGNVSAAGMQFAVDGYTVTGAPLTLSGTQAFVRVGDGGAGDAAITATINTALTGSAQLVKDMGGTLVLTGTNSYTGGTAINGGTLQVSSDVNLGDAAGGLSFDGGTLRNVGSFFSSRTVDLAGVGTFFTDGGAGLVLRGAISGAGALIKDGTATLVLAEDNSYAGGTTINAGMLRLGEGGTTGSILGNVVNNARFAIDRSNTYTLAGTISGSGEVLQTGTGTTILTGANSYTGATRVSAGTLLINGDQSAATGLTAVAANATLGGTGIIGGDVLLGDGTLAAGDGGAGTLTINGSLTMNAGARLAYDFGAANAPGSPLNDAINVGGDLTLDGTINIAVTPGGAFDIGLYRIANYGGTLTDNGLAIGTTPTGAELSVQTSIVGQVNLVNTGSAVLNFWDGNTGPKFNGAVNGGSGVWWATGTDNWTDMTGAVNASYDNGAFAVFAGVSGAVNIDNSQGAVTASGLQFAASGGYRIQGGALTLTGPQSVIRVGDGTSAGLGYSAIIASEITGSTQLVKTDLGRLELTGTNTYTGGTAINGGTVRISSDANLGAASGGISFNGGTLNTTADLTSARAVDLAGQGVFSTDAGTTLTLTGNLTGAGLIGKLGAGTLVLAGTGSRTGGMEIVQGTLLVNGDYAAATGPLTMNQITTLGGTGTIGGNVNLSGTLAPGAGSVGTLTIGGNLVISQTATLAYEFGQANAVGGALNDLVNVGGNLILDGTINVSVPAGGSFGAGIYRVFNYGGTLTDNGLTLGAMPAGSNVAVQTSIAGQVNLVNSAGLALAFWDGAAGPKNDGVIQGGNGTWQAAAGNTNWTNAGGTVNGTYSDGTFAVFGGTGGTVTVDNSLGQVTAAGMQFATNGYTITGNTLALTGPQSTIRVGDGSTAGAGFTATIDAAISGDTQLVKTDAGTLVLGGTNSYTGGTAINGGTVRIAADANLGAAAGGVSLDGGTLAISASLASGRAVTLAGAGTISTADATTFTLGGQLTGTGALTKAGAGTLLLTGDSSGYTGATTVAAGTLAVTGKLGSAIAVNGGSRLEGTGSVGSVANAGIVAPGRDGFGTLTAASYTGSGGRLEIETALGGDGSQTDLLATGATAGSTTIDVINRGGLGAQTVEGIKIVDVTGGTSAGTFTLNGDYVFEGDQAVVAGAYGYRLYKGGVATPTDGDWYLRSALLNPSQPNEPQAPLYQPGVPIYEAYGQTLLTLTDVGTLQQRIGNRQWAETESGRPSGIWGRMQSSRSRPNAAFSTSLGNVNVDSWKLEVGADHVLSERSDGASLVLGVLGGYGEASASIGSIYGSGSIKTKGYSAGATLTWFGPQGFYVDGRAQVTWFDSKLRSAVLGTLAEGNNGTGQAYSVEVGKRSWVGRTLSVTPQIQMVYQTVKFDTFTDPNDALVSSRLGDSLKTRWGLSVDQQDARSHLYGVANLSYEWLDGTVTDVSGTPIARENHRLWGELGLGGSLLVGDRLTLFTETSANTALRDFGKSYSLKATAGLRLAF